LIAESPEKKEAISGICSAALSVVSQKFVEKVCATLAVTPVKTGIQKSLKFLDSGSRHPGL
jgi:hypothetical protein